MFGKDYVVPCSFGELTGTAPAARFNARLADALFAVVNEAVDEDGHQQTQRRLTYDALKNAIEPSPTARRRFEAEGPACLRAAVGDERDHRDAASPTWSSCRGTTGASSVITCGAKMTAAERAEIRAWMADPENIGALQRALLATPAAALEELRPVRHAAAFRWPARDDRAGKDGCGGCLRGGDGGARRLSAVHAGRRRCG